MGVGLSCKETQSVTIRIEGRVGVESLNDIKGRSMIPYNVPKKSLNFGRRKREPNRPMRKGWRGGRGRERKRKKKQKKYQKRKQSKV